MVVLTLVWAPLLIQAVHGFATVGNTSYQAFSWFQSPTTRHPVKFSGMRFNPSINSHRWSRVERRASIGEENDDEVDPEMKSKLAGRKKRLTMGYKLASFAYATAAVNSIVSWGGISSSSLYYVFGGGPLGAAVILYILEGAATHDRLNSDTYKRLNLAIIAFALVQLSIPIKTLPWLTKLSFKLPGFLALVNGIKGYGYGILGWDKSEPKSVIWKEIPGGIRSTIQGMTVFKMKSFGYYLGTLMLGTMSLIKAKELATMCLVPGASPTPPTVLSVFTRLSKMARLGLMATIMYTLKDASDRDRLSGTTFVQLNYLTAAAFASIAFYLSPTWGSPSSSAQVVLSGSLSAMAFWKGFSNKKKKN